MVALCEFSPLHLLYIMICLCVSEALRRGPQRQCIQIIMVSTRQLSLFLQFPGDHEGPFTGGSQASVFRVSCTGAMVAFHNTSRPILCNMHHFQVRISPAARKRSGTYSREGATQYMEKLRRIQSSVLDMHSVCDWGWILYFSHFLTIARFSPPFYYIFKFMLCRTNKLLKVAQNLLKTYGNYWHLCV